MRLAVTRSGHYAADIYCVDSKSAKKQLKEKFVSILALDYYLAGRENAVDLIVWANKEKVLPTFVVLLERNREKRRELTNVLSSVGFKTSDYTTFIKD